MVEQVAQLAHRSQVSALAAFLAVAEMRSSEDDFASRVLRSTSVDFVAATMMLPAFTIAFTLLLTARVSRSIADLCRDLIPVCRIVARPYRHWAILSNRLMSRLSERFASGSNIVLIKCSLVE